ncbi:MAG: nitrate/nitrite transporter NrtS [Deferrisomatales bacterium]|nr:nitrate/nitrite transporter NrtS [Deferrisomatales bacterium]
MTLPPGIWVTALRTSLVVGTALTAINHGAALAAAPPTGVRLLQLALCYAVPFGVSVHSQLSLSRRAEGGCFPRPEAATTAVSESRRRARGGAVAPLGEG